MVFGLFESKEKKIKELKKEEQDIKGRIEQINRELSAVRNSKSQNASEELANTQTRNILANRLDFIQREINKLKK